MVDIDGPPGPLTAGDFEFRVNSADVPDTWIPAPAPLSVTVREGAGADGSDRVTIIWADNAIENRWVKVTVLANANTDLADDDVFCFGNAIGDTGGDGAVGADDYNAVLARFGQTGGGLAADFNADGGVDFTDFAILRSRYGSSVLAPTLAAPSPEAPAAPAPLAPALSQPSSAYYAQSTDDPVVAAPAEEIPDLLFESPGVYVSQSRAVATDSAARTLYRAATAEKELATIGDDPPEPVDAGLCQPIDVDGPLADLLAESPIGVLGLFLRRS